MFENRRKCLIPSVQASSGHLNVKAIGEKNVEVCLHSCEVVQMSFQIVETFPVIFQHYVE